MERTGEQRITTYLHFICESGSDCTQHGVPLSLCVNQRCLPGASPGDTAAIRHEEDQQAEPDPEEPDPAGLRGARHPDLRREPLRRLHVLLLRDPTAPLHGHGVRGR